MDDTQLTNNTSDYVEKIVKDIRLINNNSHITTIISQNPEEVQQQFPSDHPMRVILDMITNSANDDNLAKMPLSWNPWF
jgi:hypothetical protein